MVGVEMGDDEPRHRFAAQRLDEDALPEFPRDRRVEPAIDDRPAVTILEQPEIDVVEREGQRHAQPMNARRNLGQGPRCRPGMGKAQRGNAAVARRHAIQIRSRIAAMP